MNTDDWTMKYPNFTVTEVECPCCNKNGVDEDALAKLQALRDEMGRGLKINSAYRCAKHNDSVGGGTRSQHLLGKAFDISVRGWPQEERMKMVEAAEEIGFTGFGYYDNFLHADTGPARFWNTPWQ